MPIFEYKCQACHNEFEYFIVRSDDSPHCPHCASENIKKKVTSFSIGNTAHGKLNARKSKLRNSIKTSSSVAHSDQRSHELPDHHVCTPSCNHGP
ncbi:MAG: zinc ribbon domain-containing protein, partial [Bdellovibrionales bacterium]|nr:zinc ribbon domain-containing protein [Bdellovibrionales bacterium]